MQQDILINWSPQETRVAMVEYGAVQELHVERTLERGLVGNVYLGKVVRVLPGMQSAFIDIGLERAAFLHVADLMSSINSRHADADNAATPAAALQPIEKQLFVGQSLMVQVLKEPIGTKGARLTAQVSIAGRLLVFLPQDNHIGVSQKIPAAQREDLRQRLQALTGDMGGGFILRTNGEDATDAELGEDIAYLRKTWARIKDAALRLPPTSVLHQDLNLLQRVLRDMVVETTQSIRIDSREQFDKLRQFATEFMPATLQRLQLHSGERPIFDLFNIDEEIAKALGRRVDLKSGGYLIIDQTEALTTVDVNTGGFVGARNFDDTIFKTNLEASQAIARQLRLRNLGGIVIVDFIDMLRDSHRDAVLAEFQKQLARDRIKTSVNGFSALGLLEMTRKRTRESLAHQLCEPCSACMGKGVVKTARSVGYDILREILREARQFNPREFRVIASPKVIELFLDEESQHLAGLSDFIGKPISLQSEAAMAQEQYDIVLL
ncbi:MULTISPECIES: ribonuclease G [unclassified Polaromonas]|jgi:ribonuclease G|uniref:ribonuclease G n=1 Tax=unclassified Polaromonas TaxID=2638319 RepID=UPI000BD80F9A|nr:MULTISPECIES: ribonuclease G [unclassified Polaromonas]OYY39211.1 MAG: ribonuclease E/G [Polaromonas sp. 35-63-35]OYZ22077.1 MAG: ribonuclease E/G [Polaromonas sp. 16-63-31]OYZ80516.1 MAG: ribonuclease E/G [Polaromonas sp. 24-63-21]OZA51577.1 MAG: ribonuclease E/G [Polaromonas sp. 17-63-33]OZA89950.1 MAG: ribonuclease E/G [Polaromonas sp. 39-63-25]